MRSTSSRRAWGSARTPIAPPAIASLTSGSAHGRRKRPLDSGAAKTLYDLLDVRPSDNAETLKNAFRKAVKANHPDLNADDPEAPVRFRRITGAYAVLRHAEQRALYDRLLEFERREHRSKTRRIIASMMCSIASDAITAVCLAILIVGYMVFTHVSDGPVATADVAEVTGRAPGGIVVLQQTARADRNGKEEPHEKPARVELSELAIALATVAADVSREEQGGPLPRAEIPDTEVATPTASRINSVDGLGVVYGGPAPKSAGSDQEIVTAVNGVDAPLDPASTESTGDQPKKNDGIGPLEQNKAGSVRVSSLEKDPAISKSPSSVFAMTNEKHDFKIPAKPRTTAKRQSATNHGSFEQASLENRDAPTCPGSQSCSGKVPPLFGLGF